MHRSWRTPVRFFVVSALIATTLLSKSPPLAALPTGSESQGAWSEVADWDFIPIHASVLGDGRVLTYGGTRSGGNGGYELDLWDPSAGFGADAHTSIDNDLGTNLFCSFSVDDPGQDGKVLIGGQTTSGRLSDFTAQFNGSDLTDFASMNNPRWYPSATALWDGRVLVQGGIPGGFGDRDNPVDVAEVYSPGVGWENLEGTRGNTVWDATTYGWWYPKSHVTPAGRIWNLSQDQMYYIDPDGDGSITRLGTFPTDNHGGSSASVMFDTGLVLQLGGGERNSDDRTVNASNKATIVDLNYDPPRLRAAAPMNFPRHWADALVLPDGRVLVVGGSEVNNTDTGVAFAPEVWDPATDTWTVLASNETPRLYHSTTLLLADGSVFVGGGGAPGPQTNLDAEVFYPPYLYDSTGEADRPQITSAPDTIEYDQQFTASVDGPVDRVTLVKTNNSTHSMNTQMFQELSFSQSGNELSINSPDLATVATPGTYLLFALTADGTPSEAAILTLRGTGPTPPPPGEDVTISGTVTDADGAPVADVDVDLFTEGRADYLETATTDTQGQFAFSGRPDTCYVLTFIAPDGEAWATSGGSYVDSAICTTGDSVDANDAQLAPSSDDGTDNQTEAPGDGTIIAAPT